MSAHNESETATAGSTCCASSGEPVITWRHAAIALSLANLTFLRAWTSLLAYTRPNTFWMKAPPPRAAYAAAMVNVLLVGTLVLGAIAVVRSAKRPYSLLAWCGLLGVALISAHAVFGILVAYVPQIGIPLAALLRAGGPALLPCGLALLVVALVWRRVLARIGAAVLLILLPFVPLTFFNAVRMMIGQNPAPFRDLPPAARLAGPAAPQRILWVIFDEWDQSVSFSQRVPGLALPEVDAFQTAALYAVNAYPPPLRPSAPCPR